MLELVNIKKDYYVDEKPFAALRGISLSFPDKGFVAILGPSGCGKTTLLNIIGGLDHYTSGDLLINGKSTKDFKDAEWDAYRNEKVGFVFQSYNLIPHLSVLANVEISLTLNGAPRSERSARALDALKSVGLADAAKKRPNQLSGGQMQRVALARAIVNNPKIVLADEPTGALDSKTSVQVMDILRHMSQDRLVIMVTHNRDLANRYARRIIEMHDGSIVSDSSPVTGGPVTATTKMVNKKTSMSFLTALSSSFQSIRTKKTRTILTAVASSFGIIGVALVLAVSNGFSNYVSNVEGSVASSVPISISKSTYSTRTTATQEDYTEYPTGTEIYPYDTSSTYYISHTNYYDQNYIDNVVEPLVNDGLARSVLINREGFLFNVLTEEGLAGTNSGVYKYINQYDSAGLTGSVLQSVTSLPTTIFHELYGEEKGVMSMYDCIYGSYPKDPTDLVLITDRYNRVDYSTLKELGILTDSDSSTNGISFSDIIGKEYKAYPTSTFYRSADDTTEYSVASYDQITPHLTVDSSGNTSITISANPITKTISRVKRITDTSAGYKEMYSDDNTYNPKDLKIVGILRPSKSSYINLMPSSIGYLSSLTDLFVKDSEENAQFVHTANENAWYFSQPTSSSTTTSGITKLQSSLNSLFTALKSFSSGDGTSSIDTTIATNLANSLTYQYFNVQDRYIGNSVSSSGIGYSSYLSASRWIGDDLRSDLVGKIIDMISSTDTAVSHNAEAALLERLLEPSFYEPGHESDDLTTSESDINTDFNIVDLISYLKSYSLITSILIFPESLSTKAELLAKLDAYNDGKADSQKIIYSDIMSTFTDSLATLIRVISTVLIVFASISLVVSSTMTAIITYVSVIERTKEIGILRACGARKKDVGRLFEAECVIIGFVAGLIGIAVTWLACFPINAIVDHLYPGNNLSSIASLNPVHAVILLAVSTLLAWLSGLIPAQMGAHKDPVVALRTE